MSFYEEIVISTKRERDFRLGSVEKDILEKAKEGEFELKIIKKEKDDWLIKRLEENFKVQIFSNYILISWYEEKENKNSFYNDVRRISENYKDIYLENIKKEIRLASKNCMRKISIKYKNILFAKYCQNYFLSEGFQSRIENEYLIIEW